jgi:dsRNA-specific ribonuclease
MIDVPKVLGDIFESLIGAIFLDSGKDFAKTWQIVYQLMKREIGKFLPLINSCVPHILYSRYCQRAGYIVSAAFSDEYFSTMYSLHFYL